MLIYVLYLKQRWPGSSVGIPTHYGLDGPEIESRWGARFSAPVQTGLGAHPASCTMGTGFFPGVKSGRGVTLTPHPFQCCGHERVELYLYSPYGPCGLYKASLPVQGCTLPFLLLHQINLEMCYPCTACCPHFNLCSKCVYSCISSYCQAKWHFPVFA